jgi:hypothetical protein
MRITTHLIILLIISSLSVFSQDIFKSKNIFLKTNILQIPKTSIYLNFSLEKMLSDKNQSNNFSIGYSKRYYEVGSTRDRYFVSYERRFYAKSNPALFIGSNCKILHRKVEQYTNSRGWFDFFAHDNRNFSSTSLNIGFSIGLKQIKNRKLTFEVPISAGIGCILVKKVNSYTQPTQLHIDGQILVQLSLKI